jgi:hypothetical protein
MGGAGFEIPVCHQLSWMKWKQRKSKYKVLHCKFLSVVNSGSGVTRRLQKMSSNHHPLKSVFFHLKTFVSSVGKRQKINLAGEMLQDAAGWYRKNFSQDG